MVMQKAGAKTQGISPGSQTPEVKPWKPNPGSQTLEAKPRKQPPDDKTREPKPGRWIADREVPGLRKPGNL